MATESCSTGSVTSRGITWHRPRGRSGRWVSVEFRARPPGGGRAVQCRTALLPGERPMNSTGIRAPLWRRAVLVRLVGIVVLGLLATLGACVAAAWAATRQSPTWDFGSTVTGVHFDEARWPAVSVRFYACDRPAGEPTVVSVTDIGWPRPVVSKRSVHEAPAPKPRELIIHYDWHGGSAIFTRPTHFRVYWLSLIGHICVLGLVAYSAALLVRCATRRAREHRGSRRVSRGVCPECQYPRVQTGERCPECGGTYGGSQQS